MSKKLKSSQSKKWDKEEERPSKKEVPNFQPAHKSIEPVSCSDKILKMKFMQSSAKPIEKVEIAESKLTKGFM